MPTTPTDRDYVGIAEKYVADVLSGAIPACKWVRLACQRQADDLERSRNGWEYTFSQTRAHRICKFIEQLPHIKGALANKKLLLEPWQVFILTTVFGWVNAAGFRRFRRSYVEVPRGNGKSSISSGVGLFMLSMDKEQGAEVFSCATSRDQARIVHRDAQNMARKSPWLLANCGVSVLAHNIVVNKTASKFEALSSEGHTLDGLNTHCAIIDELHAHKTREVYDVMETSIGKRNQSLLWIITTAGANLSGICYEVRTFVTKLLDRVGDFEDESQFGIIYTMDEDDDWQDEATWIKANPNWGVSVRPEIIAQLAAKAMQLPSAQSNFKTKHLNVWVSSDSPYFNMEHWNRCANPSLSQEDFSGEPCIVGLDLATKDDLAARADVFAKLEDDGKTHYTVFARHYLSELAVQDGRNSQYQGWELTGRLIATPGNSTDFQRIEDDLLEDSRLYQIEEIAFDPWQATQLAGRLTERGATMVECRHTVPNMSEPMKQLGALINEGRIHHDGDPVLAWEISNTVAHMDAKDNVYPRKERPENKIDGVVALLMALGRHIRRDGSDSYLSAHFEQEGVSYL